MHMLKSHLLRSYGKLTTVFMVATCTDSNPEWENTMSVADHVYDVFVHKTWPFGSAWANGEASLTLPWDCR